MVGANGIDNARQMGLKRKVRLGLMIMCHELKLLLIISI